MKRWIAILTLVAGATMAMAESEFLDAFMSHYKLKEDSPWGEKSCGICHVSDSDFSFNAYGTDIKKALAEKNKAMVDGEILEAVSKVDADGDGTANGQEILASTFPGDPASGAAAGTTPKAAEPAKPKPPAKFPPKNGFHPAIVHFPIALFIAGILLDFLGMLRKDKTMLHAGWYCTVMAAVTSIGALMSGALAMLLLKLPYRGFIFTHIQFAVVSTIIMWVMVAMRVHRHEKMNVPARVLYYVLAASCFALISWAGHLGGVFVYGE